MFLIVSPIAMGFFATRFVGPLCVLSLGPVQLAAISVAVLGVLPARLWSERRAIHPRSLPIGAWVRGWLVMGLALLPTLMALLPTVVAIDLGAPPLLSGLLSWVILRVFGFRLLRLLRLARLSTPLLAIVEPLASRSQYAGRFQAFELDAGFVNAVAFPGVPRIAFTRGAVELFSEEELRAIAVHELAHTYEPMSIRLGRMILDLGPACFLFGGLAIDDPWTAETPVGVAMFVLGAVLVAMKPGFARRWEARADASAAKMDPRTYGEALLRLGEANGTPLVGPAKGTHGHLYDRIAATSAPLPKRPPPPPRARLNVALFFGTVVLLAPGFAMMGRIRPRLGTPEADLERSVVLTGGADAETLFLLAEARAARGDETAVALLDLAKAEEPDSRRATLFSASVHARLGHCALARGELQQAEKRGGDARAQLRPTRRLVDECQAR